MFWNIKDYINDGKPQNDRNLSLFILLSIQNLYSFLMEFVTVYPVFVQYIEESFLNDKKCYIYKVNPI